MVHERDLVRVRVPYFENQLNAIITIKVLKDLHFTVCVCLVLWRWALQRSRIWWELATTGTFVLCSFCILLCVQWCRALYSAVLYLFLTTPHALVVNSWTAVLNVWARYYSLLHFPKATVPVAGRLTLTGQTQKQITTNNFQLKIPTFFAGRKKIRDWAYE